MVILAHAIIYPLAMMVIFFHTPITNITVARVFFVNSFTIWTNCLGVVFFYKFVEFQVRNRVLVPRIPKSCSQEKEIYKNEHSVNRVPIFTKWVKW